MAILFLSPSAVAQLQIAVSTGTALPLSSIAIPGFINIDSNGEQEVLAATVGAGVNGTLSFEYPISESLGFGLDLTYLRSFRGNLEQVNVPQPGATTEQSFRSTAFWITPQVVGYIGDRFYTRFGLIIGSFQEVEVETQITGLEGSRIDVFESNTALGLKTAFGARFPISGKLSGFAEINANALTYRPGAIRNEQNFDGFPTSTPVELKENLPVEFDPATEQPMMTLPFNNVGINLGVKFKL